MVTLLRFSGLKVCGYSTDFQVLKSSEVTKLKGAYISLIIGCRGFGCEDNLWEIVCPEYFAGFRYDLGPLLQGHMWFFMRIIAYISLGIGRRGFGCEDNL